MLFKKSRGVLYFATLFISLVGCQVQNPTKPNVENTAGTESSQIIKEPSKRNSSQESTSKTTENSANTNSSSTASASEENISQNVADTQKALAKLDYSDKYEQTIEVNHNQPQFSKTDLSLAKGAWEEYSPLDDLNRATQANALLNQSLMPTEKRGSIASVTPTGWHNKELNGGYLYNRSHLIGYALTGEGPNPQNLITGTRQLNSPEMFRFELDLKTYLEESPQHFVRYRVTPIFRQDELLARGVQLEAQSIGDQKIAFNVYIFNIQERVKLDYQDGTSQILTTDQSSSTNEVQSQGSTAETKEYVDENGKGTIKGSKSGIYHVPGSKHYEQTTNPRAWFKTIKEAKAAGYRAPRG